MKIYFYDETSESTGRIARRDWEAVPRVGEDVSIRVRSGNFSGRVTNVSWVGLRSSPYAVITLDPTEITARLED